MLYKQCRNVCQILEIRFAVFDLFILGCCSHRFDLCTRRIQDVYTEFCFFAKQIRAVWFTIENKKYEKIEMMALNIELKLFTGKWPPEMNARLLGPKYSPV